MEYILIYFFDFLLFGNILLKYMPYANYIDEISVLIIALLFIIKAIKNKCIVINLYQKRVMFLFFGFIITGLLSNFFSKTGSSGKVIIKDILAISKFIIVYIGASNLFKSIDKEYILKKIQKKIKVYTLIMFIGAIINLLIDTPMSSDVRYGFRSYKFLYTHPTYLVLSMVIIISILSAKNRNENKLYIYCSIIILALTFRSKGLMFIIIYLILNSFYKSLKNIKFSHMVVYFFMGLILFNEKIMSYFKYGLMAARPALYIVGIKIAARYFPLGSGFGTFASSLSGRYYSPLYDEYNISSVMGLTRKNYNYMADTFWPYIYGQFGVLGLLLFIFISINIFNDLKGKYKMNNNKKNSALLIYIYLFIASTAESIFTSFEIVLIFMTLTTYLGNDDNMKLQEKI